MAEAQVRDLGLFAGRAEPHGQCARHSFHVRMERSVNLGTQVDPCAGYQRGSLLRTRAYADDVSGL